MRALLAQLGDPQMGLRGVLIAGTNGKGSVAAMVASVVGAAGYSSCRSPSPHLHSYRERITVDGQPIAAADLDRVLEEVLAASGPGESAHGPATEFELLTAAAYLWAARRQIEVVVMEVGLGGRLDASNSWDPDVAAITNVGLDHQEYLGHDLSSIATEKAQIIKTGGRAVTGASGVALQVIEAHARSLDVPLRLCGPLEVTRADEHGLEMRHPKLGRLELPLLGRHQAANAAVALGVLEALEVSGVVELHEAAIHEGLAATQWPGRLELRELDSGWVLLDGAHNPDGAAVLATTVDALVGSLSSGRTTLLAGVMADKDVDAMVQALARSPLLGGAHFVATSVPDSDRAMSAASLAAIWERRTGSSAAVVEDRPDVALDLARKLTRHDDGVLVVVGSLYLIGYVRAALLPDEVPA